MTQPFNRFAVINHLIDFLFEPENRRLAKLRTNLHAESIKLSGTPSDGILYMGSVFLPENPRRGQKLVVPPAQLVPELDAYLADERQVKADKDKVQQGLAIILRNATSDQDVRDALPDFMKDAFDGMKSLPRTKEEGFTLEENPRGKKQYEKIKRLMGVYHVSRVLY